MSSYLKLPASVVIKLCSDKLYRIGEYRVKLWDEMIAERITKGDRLLRWLPWLPSKLGLRPLTEAEARQKIKDEAVYSFGLLPEFHHSTAERRVKAILALANREPLGSVYLSVEDNQSLQ